MEVHVYLTERVIDGARYQEEVCARSWAEAEEIASKVGSKVLGTSCQQECANCGSVLREAAPVKDDDSILDAEEVE